MKGHGILTIVVLVAVLTGMACTATVTPGGGGSRTETLLGPLTNRVIPEGEALVFTFETASDGRVNISVQANTNRAEPDFQVVIGEVEDLESTPISDQVVRAPDERSDGQATATFMPIGPDEMYTIFITDEAEWPDARFTITITQRE